MPFLTQSEIENFFRRSSEAEKDRGNAVLVAPPKASIPPHGDLMTHLPPGEMPFYPARLYLIYIKIVNGALFPVRGWLSVDEGTVDKAEYEAIFNLSKGTYGQLTGETYDMKMSIFDQTKEGSHCYISIFIDSTEWTLEWHPDDPTITLIVFNQRKVVTNSIFEKNLSFYDPKKIDFKNLPPNKRVMGSGVRIKNYFLKDVGVPLKTGDQKDYSFDIYVKVPVHNSVDAGVKSDFYMIIDPDGRNQGPPANLAPIGDQDPPA